MAADAICGKGVPHEMVLVPNINNHPIELKLLWPEGREAACNAWIFGLTEVRNYLSSVELGQTEMGPLRRDLIGARCFDQLSKLTGPNDTWFFKRISTACAILRQESIPPADLCPALGIPQFGAWRQPVLCGGMRG